MEVDWAGGKVESSEEFRSKGLGSSDAATLMNISPWKDITTLWKEKCGLLTDGEKFRGNWATNRGQNLEPIARDMYNKLTNWNMKPKQIVFPYNPIFRASFDGVDVDAQKCIEIKCPGKKAHQQAIEGIVPEYYQPQVQWLLMVSGLPVCDYVSWDGKDTSDLVIISVYRDEMIIQELKTRALEFWDCVVKKIPPPTDSGIWAQKKELEVTSENPDLLFWIRSYLTAKKEISSLEESAEASLENIKRLLPSADRVLCSSTRVEWIERKGNVEYKNIPELRGIDLEKYRKPSTRFLSIKEIKQCKVYLLTASPFDVRGLAPS
jgi:putative phage-type endonuclease